MEYPLLSEYQDAILDAEDNFNRLADLRPVLDDNGRPVMSSGNFAVVFKMTDGDKDYAVKCFLKEQKERAEAYKQICGYLTYISSPYLVHTEYIEDELFVDTNQSDDDEFPVLVMDWVSGVSLDNYIKKIKDDQSLRIQLANEFRELTFWLLNQDFAHCDLKPDNILVTDEGHLVLVDYDGMFVPAMQGQEARELGTPLYRFRGRTTKDFDQYADDYACAFIMLVLMANAIAPIDFDTFSSPEVKDILPHFNDYFENRQVAPYIAEFLLVASTGRLDRQARLPLFSLQHTTTKQSTNPLEPSLVFTVNGISFKMIRVDGGTFTMGAHANQEDEAWDDEKPAHSVILGNYYIAETVVTQALWQAVMGNNPSKFQDDINNPVESVSYDDCKEFISKLNTLTSKQFRLPTEAEWEFAARGGNKSRDYIYAGSNNLDDVAWYIDNSDDYTHPVKNKAPNELGLYDMTGNVFEWCNDYWSNIYPSNAQINPQGPTSGICRVLRGGSRGDDAWGCCSSRRFRLNPVGRGFDLGFRLAFSEKQEEQLFTINGIPFKMIKVDGGTFMMGAHANQVADAWNGEKPAYSVTLSSYYIAETEVTQALWQAVMGSNPSRFKDNISNPVECVIYDDCKEFISKLNTLTHKKFRLPTEAEWEFAARGGNKSKDYIYAGSNNLDDVAWYGDNSDGHTHPVKTKAPNELGLYDMNGNVWEWCSDWWGAYPSTAQTNPQGPTSGSSRVFRGGSWFNVARGCRSSCRSRDVPDCRINYLGFRLAFSIN